MAGLRQRLTYANVTATLALVVAVGGGIAIAGGGDKPQDPNPVVARQAGLSLEPNEEKKLLKLPGIGTLTGTCNAGEDGRIVFLNRSKDKLAFSSVGANHSNADPRVTFQAAAPGETRIFGIDNAVTTDRVSVFPLSAKKVTPQLELSVEVAACELLVRVLTIKN